MKEQFILNEIWTLTFGAAFQRASVYKGVVSDEKKENLKIAIREYVESTLEPQYQGNQVSDKRHIENIYSLCDFSKRHAFILNSGKINFGISQKLLNLHLKYLWCLNRTSEPPHFPVDRRIQETLKLNPIIAWTGFEDEIEYMKIINHVRQDLGKFKSVAEYELNHFKRRVKTTK